MCQTKQVPSDQALTIQFTLQTTTSEVGFRLLLSMRVGGRCGTRMAKDLQMTGAHDAACNHQYQRHHFLVSSPRAQIMRYIARAGMGVSAISAALIEKKRS